MKVSLSWIKKLVDCNLSAKELANQLSLRSIGVKEQTEDCLELDLTYNRGDLLSLQGVAREVTAVTGSKLLFSAPSLYQRGELPDNQVSVEDKNLCPVYCLAKIEGVNVKPSSSEWVKKLKDSEVRSVNNVADITNLIMLEYGQPMHAFDEKKVIGGVKVRVAKRGEKITTLDGKVRNLNEEDLLIADEKGPIGIAGVMGGKDSEITSETTTILLEAAIFDPVKNRLTSKRHGIYSEATKRFQHGLTKTNLQQALASAIKMYEDLGGKLTAITLIGNLGDQQKTITLTREKINSLIGVEIPSADVESSLKRLGFALASQGRTLRAWQVTVPYWRLDINIEEDLIEEVARMYGYEKIPAKPLNTNIPISIPNPLFDLLWRLKQTLSDLGLTEVQTYSYYSTDVLNNLALDKTNLIKIANPISSETEYLKADLWLNLLEVVARNIKQGHRDIGIFEIGKVYYPQKGDLPTEVYHLSIALSNGTDNPLQELYQIFQAALKHLRGEKMQLHLGGGQDGKEYFHPIRFKLLGETCWIAEIHPRIVNKFGVEQRVAVLETEITKLL